MVEKYKHDEYACLGSDREGECKFYYKYEINVDIGNNAVCLASYYFNYWFSYLKPD